MDKSTPNCMICKWYHNDYKLFGSTTTNRQCGAQGFGIVLMKYGTAECYELYEEIK